jgi:hypothetical protein
VKKYTVAVKLSEKKKPLVCEKKFQKNFKKISKKFQKKIFFFKAPEFWYGRGKILVKKTTI